jgi:uncharacterized protein (TIGR03437 family)
VEVSGIYQFRGPREVGVEIVFYDVTRPLVIDPILVYSGYLGASNAYLYGIASAPSGEVYVTGVTDSVSFSTPNVFQAGNRGGGDVLVAKISSDGATLAYATYLGGNSADYGRGIALDGSGNVSVVGDTSSSDFPLGNAWRTRPSGSRDGFAAKLSADGTSLLFSTYLGGSGLDYALGVAVDPAGSTYVTGETQSSDFPTANAMQATFRGGDYDAFVTKFNASGSPVYCTLLGGGESDRGFAIAADSTGNGYVTGETDSPDFPMVNALQASPGGGLDAFVTKLNPEGSALVYSTYLGGRTSEEAFGIAVDSAGSAYVTGAGASVGFPLVGPVQSCGDYDAFVSKVNPQGSGLVYSTCLGGSGEEAGRGLRVDATGNLHVAGTTDSHDFPDTAQRGIAVTSAFRSADGGAEWTPAGKGLTNHNVRALLIDPTLPSTVYAGTQGAGVFRSVDSGTTWVRKNAGLASSYISALVADPHSPSTVYATGSAPTGSLRIWKSTDRGQTWNSADPNLTDFYAEVLAVDPRNPSTLYAGGGRSVVKSVDGGAHWTATGPIPLAVDGNYTPISTLTIDPVIPSTLYVGTSGLGVFKSADGGTSWSAASAGWRANIRALVIDTTNPSTLYAGLNNGVYRSTDAGANWVSASAGLLDRSIYSLTMDPQNPSRLYAGTSSLGVFRSDDGGNSWSHRSTGLATGRIYAIAVDPTSPSKLYAGSLGTDDTFVTRLTADGSQIVYSMFLGGPGTEDSAGISMDASGSVYVAGSTQSSSFPTVNARQLLLGSALDGFVAKIAHTGGSVGALTSVSAASFARGLPLPPASIASGFGQALSTATEVAATLPLPATLAGVGVKLQDSTGVERPAPLFFVSPAQINYLIPEGSTAGTAKVTVWSQGRLAAEGTVRVEAVSPGFFTANYDGQGVAAAVAVLVRADGTRNWQYVFQCGSTVGSCLARPIDLGATGDEVFLQLYGTGIRGVASLSAVTVAIGGTEAPVEYAGAAPGFTGLDQVNVRLPKSLRGGGGMELVLTVNGKPSNPVDVYVK